MQYPKKIRIEIRSYGVEGLGVNSLDNDEKSIALAHHIEMLAEGHRITGTFIPDVEKPAKKKGARRDRAKPL